jgi:hypothetical protein
MTTAKKPGQTTIGSTTLPFSDLTRLLNPNESVNDLIINAFVDHLASLELPSDVLLIIHSPQTSPLAKAS